jgi:hypothetical protein
VLSCVGKVFMKDLWIRFKGVPAEARRAISAQKKIDLETGRSQNPAEVGGLHQVVSELVFVYIF